MKLKPCSMEGCKAYVRSRNLCYNHYRKWKRSPSFKPLLKVEKKCNTQDCERKAHSRGYCKKHYNALIRVGKIHSKQTRAKHLVSGDGGARDPVTNKPLASLLFRRKKMDSKRKGMPFELNPQQYFELIIKPCHYCNFTPKWPITYVGVDRVENDHNIGYRLDNVAPCCQPCNAAKGVKSYEEFKEHSELKKRYLKICQDTGSLPTPAKQKWWIKKHK